MRTSILAFGVSFAVAILGLMAYDIWRDHDRTLARASESSQNLARALEHHSTQAIEAIDKTLSDAIGALPTNAYDPKFSELLRRLVADTDPIRRILVLEAAGGAVQDSALHPPMSASLADRDFFAAQRDYASVGLYVGAPMRDPADGKWTVGLSQRLRSADGGFGGIVVAFMDLAYFQRIYDSLNLGRDGVIQLLRRDGTTLIREPFDGRVYEPTDAAVEPLRNLVQWRRDGTKTVALPPDGIERIISYRSIPDRPLVVVVGLSRGEAMAQWVADMRTRLLLGLLILAAVVVLTFLLLRNLAHRDASEAALRESEQRFALAVRGTSDGLWDWDILGHRTWWSPRAKELLGHDEDADITLSDDPLYVQIVHPDDRARWDEALRLHVEEGKSYDVEYRIRRRDGSYRWFRSRGEAIRDASGRAVRMAGSISDIDAHRVAEAALVEALDDLRESEARLSSLVANIPGVIYRSAYDEGWTEMFINEGIGELTGHPATDFVAGGKRSYASVIHPDDREPVAYTVQDAVDNHHPFTVEYRIRRGDGSIRWVWERGQAVYGEDGAVLYLDGCIFDITDRKMAEVELRAAKDAAEAANEAKSQFLAHMSHELRTPLNAIIGFSEVMESELFGALGSTQYRGYAADIHQSGSHLLGVINDILDLSKIEAGRQELHEEDCDIGEIITDALRVLGGPAASQGIRVERSLQPNLPVLHGDYRMVKQILLNLLSNAVKFTPAGGVITVSAGAMPGNGLGLVVRDTGIGIPPDQVARVIEPFVQVEGAFSRRYAGTGLGLPLSKAFAELHGGRLELSSAVGGGTTVTVLFPAERTRQRASAA